MTNLTPSAAPAPASPAPTGPAAAVPAPVYPASASTPASGRPTNMLAILSISLVWINGIAGIVLGHLALSSIRRSGEEGRSLAIAGLVVGYTLTGLAIIGFIAYFAFIAVMVIGFGVSHAAHGGSLN